MAKKSNKVAQVEVAQVEVVSQVEEQQVEEVEVVEEQQVEEQQVEEVEVVEPIISQQVVDILDKTQLNWIVKREEILRPNGEIIKGQTHLYRSDNDFSMGIKPISYELFQNHQLAELLLEASNKMGIEIHKGGIFDGGCKVFIQLKSSDLKLGNDSINGFITGINSFDGTTPLAFGASNITISCRNTFYAAMKGLEKVRHTKNMTIRIEEIMKRIYTSLEEEKEIFETIVKLSQAEYNPKLVEMVTKQLFDIKPNESLEEISTTKKNKITVFTTDLNAELATKGENLWGLFSGVTKYTTHHLHQNSKIGVDIKSDQEKMFGLYGNRERVIFNKLAELVS